MCIVLKFVCTFNSKDKNIKLKKFNLRETHATTLVANFIIGVSYSIIEKLIINKVFLKNTF